MLPAALAAAALPAAADASSVGVDVTNRTLHLIDNRVRQRPRDRAQPAAGCRSATTSRWTPSCSATASA
jgi:hypothetical protein